MTQILPWIAAALLVAIAVTVIVGRGAGGTGSWRSFAVFSAAFFGFTVYAIAREGLGFWTEHTRNLWGNQIWFDLLLAAGIGWFLVLPRLRAAGLAPLPWLLVILASGSIGFLALIARLLWVEARRPEAGRPA